MEKSIELKIEYDEKEIKKAISFYMSRICNMRMYTIFVYTMAFAAILSSFLIEKYVLLSLIFAFLGIFVYHKVYRRSLDAHLNFNKKRKGGTYRFYADKIFISGEEVQSECLWSVFKEVYEIPSAFLLLDDNDFVYVFFKSCFADESEIVQLRSLFSDRFSNFKIFC